MDKLRTPNIKIKTPKSIKKFNNLATDNVEVFCRIRPLESSQETICAKKIAKNTICLTPTEANNPSNKAGLTYKESQFTFQEVFSDDVNQKDIFDRIAYPMIDDFLHGKNGVLFTYGVTCSGKTYTMNGTVKDKGILPRSLDCIFNSISGYMAKKYTFKPDKMNGFEIQTENDANQDKILKESMPKFTRKEKGIPLIDEAKVEGLDFDSLYSIFVSYIEIYNNYVYDLLEDTPIDPISGAKPAISKLIREDSNNNMFVSGVAEIEVNNPEDALELINKGQKRRKVAHTNLNSESSRSHSIFSIRLVQGPVDPAGDYVLMDKKKLIISQFSLVDLAGSERTLRTGNIGDRLKEAGNINQSLMVLRTCIEILRENQKNNASKIVPYRDSRLTTLFKTYFEGKGKVKMVICVNPKMADYEENLNVMKFAELTQEVQIVRPQVIKPETGLSSGRRLANLQHKEALTKDIEMQDCTKPVLYSLGPTFPFLQLDDSNNNMILPLLIKFLRERETCRKSLITDLAIKEEEFRNHLIEIENENKMMHEHLQQVKEQLQNKEEVLNEANRLLASRDHLNTMLESRIAVYDFERRQMEKELGENNWKMMMENLEKDRLREEYQQKFLLAQQQYYATLEKTKRRYKEEKSAKLKAILKTILLTDSESGSSTESPIPGQNPFKSKAFPSVYDANGHTDEIFKTPLYKKNIPSIIKPKPILTNRRRSKSSDAQITPSKTEVLNTGFSSRLKPVKTELKIVDSKDIRNTREYENIVDVKKYVISNQTEIEAAKGNIEWKSQLYKPPISQRKRRSSLGDSDDSWSDEEAKVSKAYDVHTKKAKFNI